MSEFRIFVGDDELPAGVVGEMNITHEVPSMSTPFTGWSRSPNATASFELIDASWNEVVDWGLGDRRNLTIASEIPWMWSRWRRWLNAVLRFMWWPLGPPRLPETYTVSVEVPDMRIDRVAIEEGRVTVDMSNAPDQAA